MRPQTVGLSALTCPATMPRMIKALEIAIEKLKRLPQDRQAYAAEVIEELAADDGDVFEIPEDHLPGALEGLAQAERGEFASDEEVERALRRPRR